MTAKQATIPSVKNLLFSLQELGILDNPNYKICFLIDSGAMITVLSSKYGLIEVMFIRQLSEI